MMKLHLHFTLPGYGFLKVCPVGALAVFEAYVAVTFCLLLPNYCVRRSSPSFCG